MTTQPASSTLRVFIITFIVVLVVLILGAGWYKKSLADQSGQSTDQTSELTEDTTPPVPDQVVHMMLTPTGSEGEYAVSISGLTEPINGIAFQIEDPDSQLSSNQFETDPALESSGWSVAVNNSASSETGQVLSFSMLRTTPAEENMDTVENIELGTLGFTEALDANSLTLTADESVVTYSSGEVARLELVTE